jgi:hypothetical protein
LRPNGAQCREKDAPLNRFHTDFNLGSRTGHSNEQGISLLTISYKLASSILVAGKLCTQTKLLGINSVDFDLTDQLLIRYSALVTRGKNDTVMGQYISFL